MKIEILLVANGSKEEYILNLTDKSFIDGSYKTIAEDDFFNILNYFLSWKTESLASNTIDGEEYFIKVTAFNEVKEYHGQGTYPANYVQFKSYLEGLK